MTRRDSGKHLTRLLLCGLIVLGSLFLLQKLLTPKYVDDVVEGALISEYYREERKDFNLIFVGDCEVYENFSPVVLWRDYGIHSYIRGSADQYVWQSYYLLEDTLRYEQPEAVIFNVLSLRFDTSRREAYNRMSLEGMKWALPKVRAIRASLLEDEHFLDYVFPILRYHSRWSQLTKGDFEYLFHTKPISHNGYVMRTEVCPAGEVPVGKPLSDYSFGVRAMEYLDRMTKLCRDRGIRLILIKAPSLYPYWYEEYEKQVEDYAAKNGLLYLNLLKRADEIGLDYTTDTCDGGLHLNLSGAEKLSAYLGKVLAEEVGISDLRGRADLDAIWEKNVADYEADRRERYRLYGIGEEA